MLFRSIAWKPSGKDYKGKSIGAVLTHLALTNNPYIKNLPSILAARDQGGEPLIVFTAALSPSEASMADEKKDQEIATLKAEIAKLKAAAPDDQVTQLKAKDDQIVSLKHEVLELKEKLENATVDEEKHEMALRVAVLERKTEAQEVRELCLRMLKEGTIKPSKVDGYAKGGDEGTISWFKASMFEGDLKLLRKWAEKAEPIVRLGERFQSGAPTGTAFTLTDEQKTGIRKLGLDPVRVAAMSDTTNLEQWKDLPRSQEKVS